MTEALLEAVRARIDVDGVPQLDGLSFETSGDRVLILGAAPALFEAAMGLREPRHGHIRVRGQDAKSSVVDGASAGVPLDPPLPLSWGALKYVFWSARLAGQSKDDARDRAREAISRLKLEAMSDVPLRKIPIHGQRAVTIAAAIATGAGTLLLEDPLRGLPDDTARSFARILVRATADASTIVFAGRVALASPIAMDADEVLVIHGSRVVGQGAPGEVAARDRAYALHLHGRGASLARLAEERGARVSGEGAHWTIDLGESLRTTDLLDMAAAVDTVVLELRPVSQAFA